MSNAVLPAALVEAIVREVLRDKLINPTQGNFLVGRLLDGHRDEGHIRVWRFWEGLLLAEKYPSAMTVESEASATPLRIKR